MSASVSAAASNRKRFALADLEDIIHEAANYSSRKSLFPSDGWDSVRSTTPSSDDSVLEYEILSGFMSPTNDWFDYTHLNAGQDQASESSEPTCLENPAGVDFEDVLDILLEEVEAEAVCFKPSPAYTSSFVPSPISATSSADWGNGFDVIDKAAEFSNSEYGDLGFASIFHSQEELDTQQRRYDMPRQLSSHNWRGEEAGSGWKLNASHTDEHSAPKRLKLSSSQVSVLPRWTGPTLLDIEAALAMASPSNSSIVSNSAASSPFGEAAIKRHSWTEEHACEEEQRRYANNWSRLLKRSRVEPKHAMKVRCEGDVVNDGYRWRKYGQKAIKNSPYPRSYYRCTTSKCSVRKQVERCNADPGVLLVTYDGIHLHHRPHTTPTCSTWHPVEKPHPQPLSGTSSPSSSSISLPDLPPSQSPSFSSACFSTLTL